MIPFVALGRSQSLLECGILGIPSPNNHIRKVNRDLAGRVDEACRIGIKAD
jgi:hypothetical protein